MGVLGAFGVFECSSALFVFRVRVMCADGASTETPVGRDGEEHAAGPRMWETPTVVAESSTGSASCASGGSLGSENVRWKWDGAFYPSCMRLE
jgi:hypothetical protein